MSDDHEPSGEPTTWSTSPDDLARVITKRPGMYLGDASFERAIGLVNGLASIVSMYRSRASTDQPVGNNEFRAGNSSDLLERVLAVRPDPDLDERDAILALEPLLAEALEAMHEL